MQLTNLICTFKYHYKQCQCNSNPISVHNPPTYLNTKTTFWKDALEIQELFSNSFDVLLHSLG